MHSKLGDTVGQTERKAYNPPRSALRQLFDEGCAELKDFLRTSKRRLARFGESDAATGWLEQLMAERAFQKPHLNAHCLHSHPEALCSA